MKRILSRAAFTLILGLMAIQVNYAQCYQLGSPVGQLSPVLKNPIAFCPGIAQAGAVCDCPPGFVATGYSGQEGNVYGAMVLSQFSLRCRQLNSNGTLGATVMVTCSNGTASGATPDGPVDAAANQALVGFEVRIGCATDAVMGASKLVTDIAQGLPNTTSNSMPGIGGTGGSPQPVMYVPNGNVIVGMQTYVEPLNQPAGAQGITAGVAWRYAPIVACPLVCSINSIAVSNISACNNNGTPSTADDTFTANVTVTFTDAPASGTLNLTGDGIASVPVGSLGAGTYTFTGVTMSADGGPISLSAAFSANLTCTLTNSNAGTAPAACSVTPPAICSISSISVSNISACNSNGTPANASDDTFTANITVNYANPPASGTLNLTGSATTAAAVGIIGATSYTFTGVTMSANGSPISLNAFFSASPACTLSNNNAGTAPASCSPNAPTIPTMSEWGLILFAMIIFTLSVVFGTQQQQVLDMGGASAKVSTRSKLPFDMQLYFKVLPLVYLGFVVIFATAVTLFGYEMTNADVPGSLLTGGVIAYLIHYVIKTSGSKD
jgi:hypothetical protein